MVISKLINIWMGWDTCSRHLVSNSKILMHCENESERRIWLFAAPRTHSLWDSPGPSTGGGGLSLLQGIFPTQGSNPGLPHYRRILYQLNHQGSPLIHWVHCQRARLCAWFVRGLSPQIHSQLSTEHRYLPDLGNPACVEWSLQTFNKLTGVMNTARTCHLKSAPPCPPLCSWWGLAQWGRVGALCLQTDVTGWDCNLSEALLPHYK